MSDRHPAAAAEFDVQRHYQDDDVAARYDGARFGGLSGRLVHALERRLLLSALRSLSGVRTVLDVPTGTGRFLPLLREHGYAPSGADVSRAMLMRAEPRADGAMLVVGDASSLPLQSGIFDVVLSFRLFPHLDSGARTSVLRELARVARGGVIVVCQPDRRSLWHVARNVIQRKNLPRHYASDAELRAEFASCGLRVERSFALMPGVFMERAYVLTRAD